MGDVGFSRKWPPSIARGGSNPMKGDGDGTVHFFSSLAVALAAVNRGPRLTRPRPRPRSHTVRRHIASSTTSPADDAINAQILDRSGGQLLRLRNAVPRRQGRQREGPPLTTGRNNPGQESPAVKDHPSTRSSTSSWPEPGRSSSRGCHNGPETPRRASDLFERTKALRRALRAFQEFLELPSREKNSSGSSRSPWKNDPWC